MDGDDYEENDEETNVPLRRSTRVTGRPVRYPMDVGI